MRTSIVGREAIKDEFASFSKFIYIYIYNEFGGYTQRRVVYGKTLLSLNTEGGDAWKRVGSAIRERPEGDLENGGLG